MFEFYSVEKFKIIILKNIENLKSVLRFKGD
jgi:hypothetical protein